MAQRGGTNEYARTSSKRNVGYVGDDDTREKELMINYCTSLIKVDRFQVNLDKSKFKMN